MSFPIQHIQFAPDRWQFYRPPQQVFVQGKPDAIELLEKLPDRGLAVVGTRQPQQRAEFLVTKTLADLAGSGLIILSGLALGIDACAHEAALEAGLATIAVLGCGIELQYPPENAALRNRILESGGLIVSEYGPSEEARPHYFLNRNRLIAGFSKATWIVQAPARSGALNTARWARDEDRDCYATPAFPDDPSFLGSQKLLDLEHAIAVWGAHSFGRTWLELSTVEKKKRQAAALRAGALEPPGFPTEDALIQQIRCHTAQSGGITLGDLLDWAMSQGMTPMECFEQLQKAQQCGLVSEKTGVFAAES